MASSGARGMFFRVSLGPPSFNLGDWSAWPEARAVCAALAAALADAPPLAGCVEELESSGGGAISARRVHAWPAGFAHPPGSAAAALPELVSVNEFDGTPFAALLTHVFALPDGVGDARRLRLTSLVLLWGERTPNLLACVFGSGAAVLSSKRALTSVAFDDARCVDKFAIAAWTRPMRAALKAAQNAQRLAAVAACVEARWSAGFRVMQSSIAAKQPELAAVLSALASRLSLARAGGTETSITLNARVRQAEALEAAGRFDEAAALYKFNIDVDAQNPGARLLAEPPLHWSFYGLALKRAGRYDEALAAYEAGLEALQSMVEMPGALKRQALFFDLLLKIVTLACAWGNEGVHHKAICSIYYAQLEQLELDKNVVVCSDIGDEYLVPIMQIATGRRFAVRSEQSLGHVSFSIVELPRVSDGEEIELALTPSEYAARSAARSDLVAAHERAQARLQLKKSCHHAPKPPDLPLRRCALCSKPAAKRCGKCLGAHYCSAECQRAHWTAHKPDCRSAAATAAVEAAATLRT